MDGQEASVLRWWPSTRQFLRKQHELRSVEVFMSPIHDPHEKVRRVVAQMGREDDLDDLVDDHDAWVRFWVASAGRHEDLIVLAEDRIPMVAEKAVEMQQRCARSE